ncbi:MAG: HU family DNA-binding protein [Clostridia bacterium]|nr:HU family DNA-binding protein [Clostridia bacterium]
MNKKELISTIAIETGLTKKDVATIVDATFTKITATMAKGDKVQLVGFGTFETRERAERIGINPQTKQTVTIPECKAPTFKAGKALKDAVNK